MLLGCCLGWHVLHHCAKIEIQKKSFPNNKCVSKFLALDCKIHAHC